MNAPENDILQTFFVLIFALCTSYAAGRLHQWYRHAHERDEAWRTGYDSATRSLFHLASRTRTEAEGPRGSAVRGTASVARHALPESPRAIAPAARASDENASRRPGPLVTMIDPAADA